MSWRAIAPEFLSIAVEHLERFERVSCGESQLLDQAMAWSEVARVDKALAAPRVGANLQQAITASENLTLASGLFYGWGALFWAIHCAEDAQAAMAPGDSLEAMGAHLVAKLHHSRQSGASCLDFVGSVLSVGILASRRVDERWARSYLDVLEQWLSAATSEEVHWVDPSGSVNLGVAHGMPGVLAVAAQLPAPNASVRRFVQSLSDFLMQTLDVEQTNCRVDVRTRTQEELAQDAWCYGAPGAGLVLLQTGIAVSNVELGRKGRSLLTSAANRALTGTLRQRADDWTLCHGKAGLAHIFNVAFQMTGDSLYRDAALAMLARTAELLQALSDVKESRSILKSPIGALLPLIAAAVPSEPAWHGMLGFFTPIDSGAHDGSGVRL